MASPSQPHLTRRFKVSLRTGWRVCSTASSPTQTAATPTARPTLALPTAQPRLKITNPVRSWHWLGVADSTTQATDKIMPLPPLSSLVHPSSHWSMLSSSKTRVTVEPTTGVALSSPTQRSALAAGRRKTPMASSKTTLISVKPSLARVISPPSKLCKRMSAIGAAAPGKPFARWATVLTAPKAQMPKLVYRALSGAAVHASSTMSMPSHLWRGWVPTPRNQLFSK